MIIGEWVNMTDKTTEKDHQSTLLKTFPYGASLLPAVFEQDHCCGKSLQKVFLVLIPMVTMTVMPMLPGFLKQSGLEVWFWKSETMASVL